jgi:hypothetical protein
MVYLFSSSSSFLFFLFFLLSWFNNLYLPLSWFLSIYLMVPISWFLLSWFLSHGSSLSIYLSHASSLMVLISTPLRQFSLPPSERGGPPTPELASDLLLTLERRGKRHSIHVSFFKTTTYTHDTSSTFLFFSFFFLFSLAGVPWNLLFRMPAHELAELVVRTGQNNNGITASTRTSIGKLLHSKIHQLPRLRVEAQVQPLSRSVLRIEITLLADFTWPQINKQAKGKEDGGTFLIFWFFCAAPFNSW